MKIHRIRVKNLNSLYGEHNLNLEEIAQDTRPFLIVGPTGSGKSTLMDAISLALFGKTPRLTHKHGDRSREPRIIMSQGETEALAEVEFGVTRPTGVTRYRAIWHVTRKYNKPDRDFRNVRRALYSLQNGENEKDKKWELLVDSDKRKYWEPPFNQALNGLTVEDFERSILLPQGKFSVILHASEKERAVLLENLTDTEHYREIGQRAAQKHKEAQDKLKKLKDHFAQLKILPEEELLQRRVRLKELFELLVSSKAQMSEIQKTLAWYEAYERVSSQITLQEQNIQRVSEAEKATKPDRERLALSQQLRPLFEMVTKRGELQALLVMQEQNIEQASLVLTTSSSAVNLAEKQLQTSENKLLKAQENFDAEKENIALAQKTWNERKVAKKMLIQAEKQHRNAEIETAKTKEAEEHAKESHERYRLAYEAISIDPLDQQLAEEEGALLTLFTKWKQAEERSQELFEEISEFTMEYQKTRNARIHVKVALQDAMTSYQEVSKKLSGAKRKLREFAGSASFRDFYDKLQREQEERRNFLKELRELKIQTISHLSQKKEIETAEKQVSKAEGVLIQHASRVEKEELALKRLKRKQKKTSERLITARLGLSLAEHRNTLIDGKPCSLCGSISHPYIAAAERFELELQKQADELSIELEKCEKNFLAQERKLVEEQKIHSDARIELLDRSNHLRGLQQQYEKLGKKLQITAITMQIQLQEVDKEIVAISDTLKESEKQITTLRNEKEILDQIEQEFYAAKQHLSTSRVKYKHLVSTEESLEISRKNKFSLRKEQEKLFASLDEMLKKQLKPFGIAPRKTQIVIKAQLSGLRKAINSRAKIEKSLLKTQDQLRIQTANAKSAMNQLNESTIRLEQAKKTLEDTTLKIGQFFDGQNPREIEDKLRSFVELAQNEKNQSILHISKTEQKIADLRAQVTEQNRQFTQTKNQYSLCLEKIQTAFAEQNTDETQLRTTILLEKEEQILTNNFIRIEAELHAAKQQFQTIQTELVELQKNKPKTKSRRNTLEKTYIKLEKNQQDALREEGVLQESLDRHDRAEVEASSLQAEYKLKKENADAWFAVHKLIGRNDGGAFQAFAQILNLQTLVDGANRRLATLTKRYRLTVALDNDGNPTLGFGILDANYASSIRPPTTLSGGETFLVSLSLALALSDYQGVQMPIETLLLDEGFGTLDINSLSQAMEALSRLQESGTQIGIISHIESLKNMIPSQILVEPLGNGRSTVRVVH